MAARLAAIALVMACLTIGGPTIARADSSPDAVYAQAGELFKDGQYVAALEAIEAGLTASPGHHNLLRLRAEVKLAVRDFEGALAAYEAFLAAGPRGANKRKAKKIVDNLDSVRTTFLEITVVNGPAQIYIDSKALGLFCVAEPVCKKGLLPGRYRMFIEREGFEPMVERIDIALGKATALERTLAEKPSVLTVKVEPAGADIQLDGKPLAAGEVSIPAGDHALSVSLAGYAPHTSTVAAHAGQPVLVQVKLAEKIPVSVSVPAAALTVDGKPVTLEGGALLVVPDGAAHTIVARAEGYRDATATIIADRPRGSPIEIQLERIPPPPPAPPPPRGRSRLRIGLIIGTGALSIAGLGLATVSGLQARDRWDEAKPFCDSDVRCEPQGVSRVEDAQRAARRSNISGGVAIAAGTASLLLLLLGNGGDAAAEAPAVSVSPTADGAGIGVGVTGGF